MLVLSRKIGEEIKIGEGITVMVAAIRGDKVRLAFDAPPDVAVWRREIWEERRTLNVEHRTSNGKDAA